MAFDKFTDKARHVLVLAREEAAALKRPHVGTEHLLLGLAKEPDGIAAQALERVGITYEKALEVVVGMAEARGRSGREHLVHAAHQARAGKCAA